MGRARVLLTLTVFFAFFLGCAGQFIDSDVVGRTSSSLCDEFDDEASIEQTVSKTMEAEERRFGRLERALADLAGELEATQRATAKTDCLDRRELCELQRSFADVAAELETVRLPHHDQSMVVNPIAGLPTPSEIASLPHPGPLGNDAYESLVRAAEAHQKCASIHADNLANLETVAFKRSLATLEECGGESHGCRVAEIRTDFSQGPFKQTNRNLDLAIEGQGFFTVVDPSTGDIQYSRAGNFAVNAAGKLVLGSARAGRTLQPPIMVPEDTVDIVFSAQGNVSVRQPGNQQLTNIGQMELATFVNPDGLRRLGENLFAETDVSGPATTGVPGESGLGVIRQGSLEESNVEPLTELVALTRYLRMLRVARWLLLGGGPDSDLDIYYNALRTRAGREPVAVSEK